MKSKVFQTQITGLKSFASAIDIINLITLKDLFKEIKNYPKQLREAAKTNQIARAILKGIGLLSKIVKLPIIIIDAAAPLIKLIGKIDLVEILKFDK